MKTPSEIKEMLADRNLKAVSKKTGIGYLTLRNLESGKAQAINLDTLEKLSNYLEGKNE